MTGVATAWLGPLALAMAHTLEDWTPTVPFVGAAVYAAVGASIYYLITQSLTVLVSLPA